jgi:maltose alpha-D-glucosyltransferase/alpha-amylase
MDPIYGYEAVNVEAQQLDPSSPLNWMRNMIALRKLFRVFGRGTLEFLDVANRKVLAYVRRYQDERVLCIANLSRFAQPVELDLSAFQGMLPVEMLGYVEFPVIGRDAYRLTLSPYAFMWFELHGDPQAVAARTSQTLETEVPLDASEGWDGLLEGYQRGSMEARILPRFLANQRWFGGKARQITGTSVRDWGRLGASEAVVALVEVSYEKGDRDQYVVPLAMTFGEAADRVVATSPGTVLCAVAVGERIGICHDALGDPAAASAFLACIDGEARLSTRHGFLEGVPGRTFNVLRGAADATLQPRQAAGEQSNTSVIYGDRFILKLFRRHQTGINPDCEIDRFLTDDARFAHVPPFAGSIAYHRDGQMATVALLQGLVPSEGDGWTGALEELQRYYEACAPKPSPPEPPDAREYVGIYLDAAAVLGRRTAELHLALASHTDDPAFAPEPFEPDHLTELAAGIQERAARAFEHLKDQLPRLPDEAVEEAGLVLRRRREFLGRLRGLEGAEVGGQRIRIHGDYHLGQVLRTKGDYFILDFEGEPARPIAERRAKHSPLKDVAGMVRSFSYAAYAALLAYTARHSEETTRLEPWARLWERSTAAEFLRAYREVAADTGLLPPTPAGVDAMLRAYLLDKAVYELLYELNNRPSWARIPLWGLSSL